MNDNYNISHGARLYEIDLLRGAAAFAVFLFHSSTISGFPKRTLLPFEFCGYQFNNIPNIFSFGATGVNLFFILSGFCLALKPLQKNVFAIDKAAYFRDRLARIYPAYFIAVCFSLIVTILIGNEWTFPQFAAVLVFLQGFIQKWHFSLNGALWSMSTEVQFYLVFPFIFIAFMKLKPIVFITLSTIFVVLYRALCTYAPSAEIVIGGIRADTFLMNMLPGRLLEFSLGIFLAYYWIKDKNKLARFCKWAFLPTLLIAVFARLKLSTAFADPLLGIMCVILVGLVITSNLNLYGRMLMAAFGRSSYSFFLLHMPILVCVNHFFLSGTSGANYQDFFILTIIGFIVSLIFGVLLYNWIEKPLLNYFKTKSSA